MKRSVVALSAIICWGLAATACAGPRLFPDEVYSAGGSSYPERFGAEALWPPAARSDYRQRIRVFIGGITVASWSIELDEKEDGRGVGVLREHDGHKIISTHRFRVSKNDFDELALAATQAKLWDIYPQFFVRNAVPNEICVDGMMLVFERVDATGYRYAEGNAQCALGQAQLAVAAKLMTIAGRPDLERFLR